MTGRLHPLPLRQLLKLILHELDDHRSVFGIPEEIFIDPAKTAALRTEIFGHTIQTPVGVAAGPHTQMAQNIIAAWLTGSRYIELKTIQTLDELDIPKPCIDMQDEGYNCEWSQELTIRESFSEYLNAWIIIHILNHRFGRGDDPGTVFNMSVGYDLKGILSDNVQWFLDRMGGCSEELNARIEEIMDICPEASETNIPSVISDSVTLSTMHGCPPDEIESIARYLLGERRLHTLVKLNPTLLGPEKVREILNDRLRFKTVVPDEAFAHDLKYPDAIEIINSLQEFAAEKGLHFGLKLTNTLEAVNNREVFGSDVSSMYMSGRALHPISVNLAQKLQDKFGGSLLISFSAGADAFNVSSLIACGFATVTVCSDLLKPGGYMRLNQYLHELNASLGKAGANDIGSFILKSSGHADRHSAIIRNLSLYSNNVINAPAYRRDFLKPPDIKSGRELDVFDCIAAPCTGACAAQQDIPAYLWYTSREQFDVAYEVILRTNPFPSVTGMVCDHLCQTKCTRINYDDPIRIRDVKRFISGEEEVKLQPAPYNGVKVAVTGAGPSGLACAYYLRLAGFAVDVFEARTKAGGMLKYAIPGFRLTDGAVADDIRRVTDLGVKITYNSRIDRYKFEALRKDYQYVFVGAGAQLAAPLDIEGADAEGVTDPLEFLFCARRGDNAGIGKKVIIIGGGNTAMDAARTAHRMTGRDGSVTVVYRRTVNEMPADQGEIEEVIKEGINIIELAAPEKIITGNGKVSGLLCSRMELKGTDRSGRPAPVKIAGSEFTIPCDTIIPAIGQITDIDFVTRGDLTAGIKTGATAIPGVYTGGDIMRGASTAINAIADGRKAAWQIMTDAAVSFDIPGPKPERELTTRELMIKRAVRMHSQPQAEPTEAERWTFSPVSRTEDRVTIVREANRCLWCDEMCNICTTVCPNMANRFFTVTPVKIALQKAVLSETDGSVILEDDCTFEIKQKYQILHLSDFCNECGNCSTFCPTSGAPFRDKPKFWLTIASFNQAEEGYFLSVRGGITNLVHKHKGNFSTLTEMPDRYIYENDFVRAEFEKEAFRLTEVQFLTPCVREALFSKAAVMAVLLRGAVSLLAAGCGD